LLNVTCLTDGAFLWLRFEAFILCPSRTLARGDRGGLLKPPPCPPLLSGLDRRAISWECSTPPFCPSTPDLTPELADTGGSKVSGGAGYTTPAASQPSPIPPPPASGTSSAAPPARDSEKGDVANGSAAAAAAAGLRAFAALSMIVFMCTRPEAIRKSDDPNEGLATPACASAEGSEVLVPLPTPMSRTLSSALSSLIRNSMAGCAGLAHWGACMSVCVRASVCVERESARARSRARGREREGERERES
jgi:hypothetical protein